MYICIQQKRKVTDMEWIGLTIVLFILMVLILAFIGMWNTNTDKLTEFDLYGMDADEFFKKQVREKIEEIIEQSFDVVRIGNKVYYTSKGNSDENFKRRLEELLIIT